MIDAFKFLSREVRGMHQAAYVIAAFSLGSQILALFRDRLLAAVFGAGHTLDIYYAAFRLPDFIFATVASLLSLYALLPVLTHLDGEGEGVMISFLRRILVIFFAAMVVVALCGEILAPVLAPIIAPGFAHDPKSLADLILLMRVLLLQPILLGASNTIASLTQFRHRFLLYSVSPLLYNIGIITGALVLYPVWGIAGLGWGVVFGAFMHLAIQLPYFFAEKTDVSISAKRLMQHTREVILLSAPRTLALAASQLSLLAITIMASYLAPGSIAVFTFAFNLQSVPLTIIGVSYAVAAFPTLARHYARSEMKEFVGYVEAALRHIVFWSIPAIIFMIVLRAQIVRVILGAGQFDWEATRLTAAALALFIISLSAQSIKLLIARAYYAAGNTRKPLLFGLVEILISISSALILVAFFRQNMFFRTFIESLLRVDDVPGTTVLMLALGYTLGSIVQFIFGIVSVIRDFSVPYKQLVRLTFESFSASVIGGAAAYGVLFELGSTPQAKTTLGLAGEALCAGIAGLIIAATILWLLQSQELSEIVASFMRRFRDTPPVAVEPSDVSPS